MVITIICLACFRAKNGAFPSRIEFFKLILYNLKNNSAYWRFVNVIVAVDFKIFPGKIEVTYMHWDGLFTDFTFMSITITHLHLLVISLPNCPMKSIADFSHQTCRAHNNFEG